MRLICPMILMLLVQSCAILHKVQLSDLDPLPGKKVSIKISETTIDLKEVGMIMENTGKLAGNKSLEKAGDDFQSILALAQFGPKTGTPVYNDKYARNIPERLMLECHKGRFSQLISVRETMSYPVVKGEIVRIEGICHKNQGSSTP